MKKIQIKTPVPLPHFASEKDTCEELINKMEAKVGIEKAHYWEGLITGPLLCFHYDPD